MKKYFRHEAAADIILRELDRDANYQKQCGYSFERAACVYMNMVSIAAVCAVDIRFLTVMTKEDYVAMWQRVMKERNGFRTLMEKYRRENKANDMSNLVPTPVQREIIDRSLRYVFGLNDTPDELFHLLNSLGANAVSEAGPFREFRIHEDEHGIRHLCCYGQPSRVLTVENGLLTALRIPKAIHLALPMLYIIASLFELGALKPPMPDGRKREPHQLPSIMTSIPLAAGIYDWNLMTVKHIPGATATNNEHIFTFDYGLTMEEPFNLWSAI